MRYIFFSSLVREVLETEVSYLIPTEGTLKDFLRCTHACATRAKQLEQSVVAVPYSAYPWTAGPLLEMIMAQFFGSLRVPYEIGEELGLN